MEVEVEVEDERQWVREHDSSSARRIQFVNELIRFVLSCLFFACQSVIIVARQGMPSGLYSRAHEKNVETSGQQSYARIQSEEFLMAFNSN
jgi:hypothetical protein